MKISSKKLSISAVALLMCSTSVYAQETTQTRSLSASTSTALQGDTGFLTGGQVSVTGVGQGSVALGRAATGATITSTSGATAGIGSDLVPNTSSSMVTTFDFDRSVDTAGALVGIGTMTAQGESIGGTGIVGASTANSESAGTRTVSLTDQAGSAASTTSAQAGLVGSFSTVNTIQMLGQDDLFAGAQALDIGERNSGIAGASTGLVDANTSQIDLTGMVASFTPGSLGVSGSGSGSVFATESTLENTSIDLNVANAGGGSILVTGSTGGFFGSGTIAGAGADVDFAETNGFFSNP